MNKAWTKVPHERGIYICTPITNVSQYALFKRLGNFFSKHNNTDLILAKIINTKRAKFFPVLRYSYNSPTYFYIGEEAHA